MNNTGNIPLYGIHRRDDNIKVGFAKIYYQSVNLEKDNIVKMGATTAGKLGLLD